MSLGLIPSGAFKNLGDVDEGMIFKNLIYFFFLLKMVSGKTFLVFYTFRYVCIFVSTDTVDMDLARVRSRRQLRRRSLVRDFTVTALQPTVFYLELLYSQFVFSRRKSCLGIFLASF